MKISKAQIKKIIKEELIKEMALEDADPIKVFGAFALIRVKLDNLKDAVGYADPDELLADIDKIHRYAKKNNFILIEDVAQAIGTNINKK